MTNATLTRLSDHVDRLGTDHPPIPLDSVDFTVRRPDLLARRYGGVLDYMARTEMEVERNVLELTVLLPDPPALDRRFYAEIWGPQERQHGLVLDELQRRLGLPSAEPDLTTVSTKVRVVGLLAHLSPVQDVVRMLYYLTGMTTERSAVIAYRRLRAGAVELGERAVSDTVIAPIQRQEPGHYAYYRMAAELLWSELSAWQRWLVRRLRALSFTPVGAGTPEQRADVGDMMIALGVGGADEVDRLAAEVARVEAGLLDAGRAGLRVPAYIVRAFREAVLLAEERGDVASG